MVSTTADSVLCDPVATDFRYSDKARRMCGEAAGASPPSQPRGYQSCGPNFSWKGFQGRSTEVIESLTGEEGGLAPAGWPKNPAESFEDC